MAYLDSAHSTQTTTTRPFFWTPMETTSKLSAERRLTEPPNKQLQRTVNDKVLTSTAPRPAAELGR